MAEQRQRMETGSPSARRRGAGKPLNPIARWTGVWDNFVRQHGDWVGHLPKNEAAYMLPDRVVEELAADHRHHRASQPLLNDTQVRAEGAFREVCQRFGNYTCGVLNGLPVQYPLLSDSWGSEAFQEFPDKTTKLRIAVDRHHDQQRVYVAALCFHQPYRKELATLRQKWESIPELTPLPDPWINAKLVPKNSLSESLTAYVEAREAFCARWHLIGFISWDLPQPRGSLEGVTIGHLMSIAHPSLIVDYQPPFMDTPPRSVRQKAAYIEAVPNDPLGPQSHLPAMPKTLRRSQDTQHEHVRAFQMWLLESTARRRYGNPRGMTSALLRGFNKLVEINEDRLSRLRQIYKAFLPA